MPENRVVVTDIQNRHPLLQITPAQGDEITTHIENLCRIFGVSSAAAKEIFRVGYETAWNHALTTCGATKFSRLVDKNGNPVFV